MATSNLYLYKTVYELTILDNGQRLEGPMYNNTIKIHKGIDDKITFNVYDENRRLASISHLTLAVNIIDANSGALVLAKAPVIRDDVKGTLDVTFSWGDTANIDAGLYEFSITTTDVAGESSALYTDLSQSAIGTIEILDNILPSPAETLSMANFTVNGVRHESDPVSASPNRSYQSSLHTCAVYTTNYTGKFYVEGSHDLTSPTHWFVIDLHPANTLMDWNAYTATSGIDPFNFSISTNWFRFVHIPTVGALATMDTFSAADALRTAGTYTGVTGTSSGSGTVETFDIVVDGTGAVTSVTIVTSGVGHSIDDTITIADSSLGSGGAAAFTMDVATITGTVDKVLIRS